MFSIKEGNKDYWRLINTIKWQQGYYDPSMLEPLIIAPTNAFKKLKFKHPEVQAQLLLATLDGMATNRLLLPTDQPQVMMEICKKKYGV